MQGDRLNDLSTGARTIFRSEPVRCAKRFSIRPVMERPNDRAERAPARGARREPNSGMLLGAPLERRVRRLPATNPVVETRSRVTKPPYLASGYHASLPCRLWHNAGMRRTSLARPLSVQLGNSWYCRRLSVISYQGALEPTKT